MSITDFLRIKKTRSSEDLALEDFTVKKEIRPIPKTHPDIYPTLQKSQAKIWVEKYQKQKNTSEFLLGPQQYRYQNHGRSRRFLRRLKTRSITNAPYELNNNQLKEIAKSISEVHKEGSIHIKPVLRVTTKQNVFDSIVDIMQQLLNPPKKEPGPLVGPINMPGSARKIYLRLTEPVDSSHVMVRFVTEIPVPVIEPEYKNRPIIPIPPIDPTATLLKNQHIVVSDAVFASTRHLPRNVSYTSGKTRVRGLGKPGMLKPKSPLKNVQSASTNDKESFLPGKGGENMNPFAELNLENHSFLGEPSSYYQAGEDAIKQVKQLLNDSTTAIENGDSKDPPGTWYELNTHHLPVRQIASMYPLTTVEHTESSSPSSYEDTYKVPRDVLTGPTLYTSPYAQFNNANSASKPYDSHHNTPNSYLGSHNQPNDVHTTPSSYSILYQKQNEFNGSPTFYPTSSWNQEETKTSPSTYSTSHEKPNDLYGASSSYMMSYAKPTNTPFSSNTSSFSSYEKQNGNQSTLNSNDALRVIDPPTFFPAYQRPPQNPANRSSSIQGTTIRQSRYKQRNLNEVGSNSRQRDGEVIWGETKRKKNMPSLQQNGNPSDLNNAQGKWQPDVSHPRGNTDWQGMHVDLTNNRHKTVQPFKLLRQNSRNVTSGMLEKVGVVDRYQNTVSRRRGTSSSVNRAPKCPISSKEVGCEPAKPTLIPDLETSTKIIEKPVLETKPIVVGVLKTERSNAVENMSSLNVATERPTMNSTTSSLIERSLPLIMTTQTTTMNSTMEIPLPLIRSTTSPNSVVKKVVVEVRTSKPTVHNVYMNLSMKPTMKPTSNVTEKQSAIESIVMKEAAASSGTVKKLLPKRPMIMKKPTSIMKRIEPNSITMKTVVSSTTQRSTTNRAMKKMTTRRLTFRDRISRTKSSTI